MIQNNFKKYWKIRAIQEEWDYNFLIFTGEVRVNIRKNYTK